MICRTCLRRAAAHGFRASQRSGASTSASASATRRIIDARAFSTTLPTRNATLSPSPSPSTETAAAAAGAAIAPTPLATPASEASAAAAAAEGGKAALSSCPAGTVLKGLNYFKGREDPVALPDEAYPAWLWRCLDVQKAADADADADAGDEFSKSKKQRRLAAKKQRLLEAKLLAAGDIEALAPKIPLQQQSINLPGSADGGVEDSLHAATKREELRKAMRKERKAKIKEANYLKSM